MVLNCCRVITKFTYFQHTMSFPICKQFRRLVKMNSFLNTTSNFHQNFCTGVVKKIDENLICRGLSQTLDQCLLVDDLKSSDLLHIKEKFIFNDLQNEYLHKYNVKVSSDFTTTIFPFDSIDKNLAALEFLTYKKDVVSERLIHTISDKSSRDVLFGWSLIGTDHKELVVTSHPFDAVAVNQETDIPAISLPTDFTHFSSAVLDALKRFSKITFWLKPSLHVWEIHKTISLHLGKRAFFIQPQDFPCALTSLQCDSNLKHILLEAFPLFNPNLETFDSYVDIVQDEIKGHEKQTGLKWKRFDALNDLLKGHRPGELTVFSGQTGTGKTTFMSEYSLDLCLQGLPTLWASFEISNTRLMKTMLSQYSQCSLINNMCKYKMISEEFCKVPMFFLNFHGSRTLKAILKAMSDAVIIYNIGHIVVDNLQFMMNMEEYSSFMDQYRRQDHIYGCFRDFATRWGCHITLVIHPKKEPEFTELNNTSISGTAKATQEADNIIILQTTKMRQYLQVTKNRFDGQKGCLILEFDKATQTYCVKNLSSKAKSEVL